MKPADPAKENANAQSLERDFDFMMERANIVIPPDRRKGAMGVFGDLMNAAELVHTRRPPSQWSSQIFRVETISRTKRA